MICETLWQVRIEQTKSVTNMRACTPSLLSERLVSTIDVASSTRSKTSTTERKGGSFIEEFESRYHPPSAYDCLMCHWW